MNTNVLNRTFNLWEIGSLIRIVLGINLLFSYFFLLGPNFDYFFGQKGMVNPDVFHCYDGSPLFYVWDNTLILKLLFILLVLMAICFTIGFYSRLFHVPLYLLHLTFHHANPFIVHGEPDQLTNLMLVFVLFFPIEGVWVLRKTSVLKFFEEIDQKYLSIIFKMMLFYLAAYYFFAGIKKLPDPLWRNGEALKNLLSWPLLGKTNGVNEILLQYPFLLKLASFVALIYEIGFFVFVLFSKLRRWLIPFGIIFHILINLMIDVGHFHLAIWMWYPLLLIEGQLFSLSNLRVKFLKYQN